MYIIYTIFPLLSDTVSLPVWLPSMASVAFLFVLYPKAFYNTVFYWFLAYAFVLWLYQTMGKPLTIGIGSVQDSKKLLIEYAYILPTISIFCILKYLNDHQLTKRLILWSVVGLYVSFVVSVPLMLKYNSLREALSINGEEFYVAGLPGYSLMHAYTLFIPAICYAVKITRGIRRWIFVVALMLLCYVVYDTFVTTSLIIMISILFFTLIYTDSNTHVSWIVFFIVGIFLVVLYERGFFISVIDWSLPLFEGTPVESKLLDFKESMIQGRIVGGTISVRQERHDKSWVSFGQNPIFGTGEVGGHSSILDRLGGMGIFAGIPFIMIFVSFIQQMVKCYKSRMARTFFWVGIAGGLVFLYQKGLWGSESWLIYMVLMPMIILVIERKELSYGTTTS